VRRKDFLRANTVVLNGGYHARYSLLEVNSVISDRAGRLGRRKCCFLAATLSLLVGRASTCHFSNQRHARRFTGLVCPERAPGRDVWRCR
jgi:hypothetical protein